MKRIGPTWARSAAAAGLCGHQFGADGLIEVHDQQNRIVRIWKDDAGVVQEARTADTGTHPQVSEAQITAIKACLAAHDPAVATFQGAPVWDAASVDAVTATRIRTLIDGADPIQDQLKQLRLAVWAHEVKRDPGAFSAADQTKAEAILAGALALHNQIETIRAEGKAFKQERGWS